MPIITLLSIFGVPGLVVCYILSLKQQGLVVNNYTLAAGIGLTVLTWVLVFIFWHANTWKDDTGQWYLLRERIQRRARLRRQKRQIKRRDKEEKKRRMHSRKKYR